MGSGMARKQVVWGLFQVDGIKPVMEIRHEDWWGQLYQRQMGHGRHLGSKSSTKWHYYNPPLKVGCFLTLRQTPVRVTVSHHLPRCLHFSLIINHPRRVCEVLWTPDLRQRISELCMWKKKWQEGCETEQHMLFCWLRLHVPWIQKQSWLILIPHLRN